MKPGSPASRPAGSLADRLAARIRRDGPMPLAAFMTHALGDREQGYYRRRDAIGALGDFITAPEISQIFGELIGLWIIAIWEARGAPGRALLVELGPGRGTLLADALRAAGKLRPALREALSLHLVESNETLRDRQREALAALGWEARWHERLEDVPNDALTILVANEFLDALPIRLFERAESAWHERAVALDETGRFVWARAPEPLPDEAFPPVCCGAPPGSLFETAPAVDSLILEIAARLSASNGAALLIDYGHTQTRLGQTLQALRRHTRADPLETPGEIDLTAHVDFARVGEVAWSAGLAVHGPVTQGDFLRALGIEQRLARLAAANPARAEELTRAVKRLTGPAEMGSLFKALALTDAGAPPPPGFTTPRDGHG